MKSRIKVGVFFVFSLVASVILIADSSRVFATVPYITERVNFTYTGGQMTTGNMQGPVSLSQDGRYAIFSTTQPDIVAGDTNNAPDIFVRDRKLGTTVRANVSSTGAQLPSGFTSGYKMSPNGRFVIFASSNTGVVPGDTNGMTDLFLRDLKNNTTEIVSLTSSGNLSSGGTGGIADLSADGRYVVFTSAASDFVSGDTNGMTDVFIRDRKLGTTTLLSKSNAGTLSNAYSYNPSISCDGSYVTFTSEASTLVSGDTNGLMDVFLVDRIANNSISNITINANDYSQGFADISCNGETIAFRSKASNLVANDTNNAPDIFAYNIADNTFERVNIDSAGNQTVWSANPSNGVQSISNDSIDFSGRYVVFEANTDTLVSGDTNNTTDIFLRDLKDGTTQIISKRSSATQTTQASTGPSISLDGREVVFTSADSGFVSGDTNSIPDVFVSKTGI